MDRADQLKELLVSLKYAESEGLRAEFRAGYLNYRRCGETVEEACWCALYDWDI